MLEKTGLQMLLASRFGSLLFMPREQEETHTYALPSKVGFTSFPVPHRPSHSTPGPRRGPDPMFATSLPLLCSPRYPGEWAQADMQNNGIRNQV